MRGQKRLSVSVVILASLAMASIEPVWAQSVRCRSPEQVVFDPYFRGRLMLDEMLATSARLQRQHDLMLAMEEAHASGRSTRPGPVAFAQIGYSFRNWPSLDGNCDRGGLPAGTRFEFDSFRPELALTLSSPSLSMSLSFTYAPQHLNLDYYLPDADEDEFERLREARYHTHTVELRVERWLALRYGEVALIDDTAAAPSPSSPARQVVLGLGSPVLGLSVTSMWSGRDGEAQLDTLYADLERVRLWTTPFELSLRVARLRDADQFYGVAALDWLLTDKDAATSAGWPRAAEDARLRLEIAPELNAPQLRFARLAATTGEFVTSDGVLHIDAFGAVSLFSGQTMAEVTGQRLAWGWTAGFRTEMDLYGRLGWLTDFSIGSNRPRTLTLLPHLVDALDVRMSMSLKLGY